MKIVFVLLAVLALFTSSGCSLTGDATNALSGLTGGVDLSDGKILGVKIPDEVMQQGRDGVRAYLVGKYPAAAPIVDVALDRFFPPSKIGPPSFIQVPVTYVTNLTVQLKPGVLVNGSQFLSGDLMESVFVETKAVIGMPAVPAPKTVKYSPNQFATVVSGIPVQDAETPTEPEDTVGPDTPPADDLEANPALPPE